MVWGWGGGAIYFLIYFFGGQAARPEPTGARGPDLGPSICRQKGGVGGIHPPSPHTHTTHEIYQLTYRVSPPSSNRIFACGGSSSSQESREIRPDRGEDRNAKKEAYHVMKNVSNI